MSQEKQKKRCPALNGSEKKKRPEWVRCVRHPRADKSNESICGRVLEVATLPHTSIDMAFLQAEQQARLLICFECSQRIIKHIADQTEIL